MKLKNINWKNVLVLVLVLIIGFTAGMVVTFEIVLKKLAAYNLF